MEYLQVIDLGIKPYREVWDLQHQYMQEILDAKSQGKEPHERILLVEHLPVYTLGFHGQASNMLASEKWLQEHGIEVVRIERGGDITFHGLGQLVVYPILDLEAHGLGVKTYVNILEQAVIDTLALYAIKAGRVENATGVWVNIGTPKESKICAIGIKCRHYATMHGLALNGNTNLDYFHAINPCGFTDRGVASIEQMQGKCVDMEDLKAKFTKTFLALLQAQSSKQMNAENAFSE